MNHSILIASKSSDFKSHCEKVSQYLKCSFTGHIDHIDNLDVENNPSYSAAIIDTRNFAINEYAGVCQVVSHVLPTCKSILIVDEKIGLDQMKFIYASGAELILTIDEFFNQSKLEFFLTYLFNFEWIPVKSYDFLPNTEPDFMVYHLLSYRNKFVPIIHGTISEVKFKNMGDINELYIKRQDLPKFCAYLEGLKITSQNGVLSKCRGLYSLFVDNYIHLVLTLSDTTKIYSFENGQKILSDIQRSASNLLDCLASVEDPWLVVDNLCQKDISNPLFRTPAVAVYSGISALNMEKDPQSVMVACLLANVGLLKLSHQFLLNKPSDEDKFCYSQHPLISINTVLERKLPVPEDIKKIILNSHENPEGTGFPKGKNAPSKIPWESQLIQICEILDQCLQINPGSERLDYKAKRNLFVARNPLNQFSLDLVLSLKKMWS